MVGQSTRGGGRGSSRMEREERQVLQETGGPVWAAGGGKQQRFREAMPEDQVGEQHEDQLPRLVDAHARALGLDRDDLTAEPEEAFRPHVA